MTIGNLLKLLGGTIVLSYLLSLWVLFVKTSLEKNNKLIEWEQRCFNNDGVILFGKDKFGVSVQYCIDIDSLKKV